MHHHGYKGKKLGRERDQRRALVRGLATSLVNEGHVETTLPKAKVLVPYVEKLITKAHKGDLASRRSIIASLTTVDAANKLVDALAPQMKRTSGHIRVIKTRLRVGDGSQMARVEFVDKFTEKPVAKPKPAAKKVKETAK